MKKVSVILMAIVLGVVLTGCGGAMYPYGGIFNKTTTPHPAERLEVAGQGKTGSKVGEACATGFVSVVALGDASVDAAKKAGGITDVHTVEFQNFSILGVIYQKSCTVVTGE